MEATEGNDTGFRKRLRCMRSQARTSHAVPSQSISMISSPRNSRDSAGSGLILMITFVAAFAVSLWLKWQPSQQLSTIERHTIVESTLARQGEDGFPANPSAFDGDLSAAQKLTLGIKGVPVKQLISPAGVEDSAQDRKTQGSEGAGESHDEWLQQLYTRLYTLESPAAGTEEPSPVISGRVLTPAGQPVTGVEVSAQLRQYFKTVGDEASARQSRALRTTTNGSGFYAFRDLSEGIYMISTQPSGSYAPARLEVHTGVKYADLVLESQRMVQVSGVVTDAMGTGLEGVHIMPLVSGAPEGAVSQRDGRFELAVALKGDVSGFPVRFREDGYQEQRYQVVESDWSENSRSFLTVTMEPVYEFCTVSGSVKDVNGVQIAGETARLYSPRLKHNYRAVSDAAGEFQFAAVEIADDYQLWIHPVGPYRDFTESGLVFNKGNLRRDIVLESLQRGYRLSGKIRDQDGNPVPDLTLTLRNKYATSRMMAVTSDSNGNYVVENVPEGEILVESRTLPYYTLSGIYLSGDNTEQHVNLTVNRGQHKLLGKIVDSDGRPISTSTVFISSLQIINGIRSQSRSTTSADARGRFLFTDLGSGPYTVRVNAPGYEGFWLKKDVGMQDEFVIRLEKSSI